MRVASARSADTPLVLVAQRLRAASVKYARRRRNSSTHRAREPPAEPEQPAHAEARRERDVIERCPSSRGRAPSCPRVGRTT